MAFETKQVLGYEGLKAYTSKILELINSKADKVTIEIEIANLYAMIGDISKLGENYKNLVVALLAEIERAKAAEEALSNGLSWGSLGSN